MKSPLRPAIVSFVLLTIITGIGYPLLVTLIAHLAFPRQATGSMIEIDGKLVGSELIGQQFSDPKYFWSRPSATTPVPYAGDAGTGSNLAPSNPDQQKAMAQRANALRLADPTNRLPIPIDLLTASASGLDPHISVEAAEYQIGRVARARRMSQPSVLTCVKSCIEPRTLAILGEERVNVLRLNLKLDRLARENE